MLCLHSITRLRIELLLSALVAILAPTAAARPGVICGVHAAASTTAIQNPMLSSLLSCSMAALVVRERLHLLAFLLLLLRAELLSGTPDHSCLAAPLRRWLLGRCFRAIAPGAARLLVLGLEAHTWQHLPPLSVDQGGKLVVVLDAQLPLWCQVLGTCCTCTCAAASNPANRLG